jgi:hypothetical protein
LVLAIVPGAFIAARESRAQEMMPDDVLSFALTLEYLEWQYYDQALSDDSALSFPGNSRSKFAEIRDHEFAHVRFLEDQLGLANDESLPQFDFTADNIFDPGPFEDYSTFLLLAQAFEDIAVRAYQGGAPALVGTDALTPALQIHATEAGHAAVVRRLVAAEGLAPNQDAWIEGAGAQAPGTLSGYMNNAIYSGEGGTTVASIDVSGVGDYSDELVTEAYDKPLDMTAVSGIVEPFVVDSDGGDENLITSFSDPANAGSGQPISMYGSGINSQQIANGEFVAEVESYGGNGRFPGLSIKLGGLDFSTPVDFTKTPVIRLDIKVSVDSSKDLPVHMQVLTDNGTYNGTDATTRRTAPANGNFSTYYFDASGASSDQLSTVNELIFHLNEGNVDPFTGTITFDTLRRRADVPSGS